MRSITAPTHHFYSSFREWLKTNYPELNEESWSIVVEEDSNYDYDNLGSKIYDSTEGEEPIGDNIINEEGDW